MALGGIIRGKTTTLRTPAESDLPAFARWMADMRVRRIGRIWHEPAMPATWKERLAEQAKDERSVLWTIERDGATVGLVRIEISIENLHGAHVQQFIVDPERWRSGVGWDAALALHRYLFDYLDMQRVTATLHSDNAAAIRIATRLGYVEFARGHEVHYRDGGYSDATWLLLEHPVWDERFAGEREYEPIGSAS